MNKRQLITPDRLRRIAPQARRLIKMSMPHLISITVGVLFAAVVGGVVGGLDYIAFIADLHHRHEIDAFAFHYLDFLLDRVIEGAVTGAGFGVSGALAGAIFGVFGASKKFGARKTDVRIVVRIAGGIVALGVVACIAFVVLAAFGIVVHGPIGPQGYLSPGASLIGCCSFAAGLLVGAARSGD
uniref:hypothetical protein n=1 Tax=Actinomadura sp. CA-154981 TaxID=3240037 RepID=UPI003F49B218